jgi:hypothetical protein
MGKPWESHGDHMFGGENPGDTLLYVILKSWAWDIEVYHQHLIKYISGCLKMEDEPPHLKPC